MSTSMVVALLVVTGIALGLGLLTALTRRNSEVELDPDRPYPSLSMSVGVLVGAVLGTIAWIATGQLSFLVIFTGCGIVSGLAIGASWAVRHH
jgi:O-antigen/teichoic acid export membrane protein